MKNKKLWIGIGIVVIIGIVIVGVFKKNQILENDDAIRIGAILPLTGVSSDLAEPMVCAMKIAEKTINDNRNADQKKIKIIFEDGKSTASDTISAYQKLLYMGIDAYIVFGDVQCYNLAPEANKHSKTVMALSAAAENIPELSSHVFRAWTTTHDSCEKLSEFAHNNVNASKFAIMSINNNFGDEATKTVCDYAKKNGVTIVQKETFEIDAQEVRGQILKILKSSPDAVFVFGFGPGYITVFNQLKESGYSGPILTDEVITIPGYVDKIIDNAKGVYYSSTAFDPEDTKSLYYDVFVTPFKSKMQNDPNAHAAFAYFSVDSLSKAIDFADKNNVSVDDAFVELGPFPSIIGSAQYNSVGELKTEIFIRIK